MGFTPSLGLQCLAMSLYVALERSQLVKEPMSCSSLGSICETQWSRAMASSHMCCAHAAFVGATFVSLPFLMGQENELLMEEIFYGL